MTVSPSSATRCGFIAIVGAPNVGKSTLLNRLVGTKVSIVTPKVQTTRRRVLGITVLGGRDQVVFVDTPGIFAPARRLERAMVGAAWRSAEESDLVVLLVDARKGADAATGLVLEGLRRRPRRSLLAINKLDLVRPHETLPLIKDLNERGRFEETFIVSATTGDGCDDLLHALPKYLPEGPWLFPEDQLSDLSNRALAAEITREKVFLALQQELPYSITVETEAWTEPEGAEATEDGGEVRIDQTIYVMRPTQKAIVLGKGGRQIKAIGQAAREELERILERRVHLFLFVKVRERWTEDPERYAELGLDFPG